MKEDVKNAIVYQQKIDADPVQAQKIRKSN